MRSRTKRDRWRENQSMERVHEPDLARIAAGSTYLRGRWCEEVFDQEAPITLELGCGQGMFAVELARRFPGTNVVGVDLKGHRFWRGAKAAHVGGLLNAAFLRARIQWLDHFFAPAEVGEVWLTFSDPQNGDKRGTKRLTSPHYLRLYQSLLVSEGVVHVKTDSPEFFENTLRDGPLAGMVVEDECDDVHGAAPGRFDEALGASLAFKTAYEERWIREGRRIHYVRLGRSAPLDAADLALAKRMLQGPPGEGRPAFTTPAT